MTTTADIALLDLVSSLPHKQRLTALIRELTADEGIDALSSVLGYNNPGAFRVMLRMNRVALRHLPGIADHLAVDLGVLLSVWVAQEAEPDHAEAFFQACRPKITDAEEKLIQVAREAITDDLEAAADDRLLRDIRSGALQRD